MYFLPELIQKLGTVLVEVLVLIAEEVEKKNQRKQIEKEILLCPQMLKRCSLSMRPLGMALAVS